MGLICHQTYRYKRKAQGDFDTHGGREGGVTTEAEIEVMQSEAKESQQPQEAARNKK